MLTVIIAEKHIIEQYEKNKLLLAPFKDEEIVFCEWHREAVSIDEMLPELKNKISFNTNWRAVIVTDSNKEQINPFDFVNYAQHINRNEKLDLNSNFVEKCQSMFECYDSSSKNPLTRLSAALCEIPYFAELIEADIEALAKDKKELLRYIFKIQFEPENTRKLAAELSKFRREQLATFVPEKKVDDFLNAVAEKDYSVIFELLSEDKLMVFLNFAKIGNSTTQDPGYWYAFFENTKKAQIYAKLKDEYKLKNPRPQDVICIAMRTCDTQIHKSKVAWADNNEAMYADFVRYNLYNENIRFLVYDMPEKECANWDSEVLKFHILLQVLAMHGNSAFSISKNKVFEVDIEYDKREFNRTIAKLIARLKATAVRINEEIYTLKSKKIPELDNKTARLVFENDVKIPVQIDKEYDSRNLLAEYKIGLSRDCPREELIYWDDQYNNIRKLFKRFLREPRRAVKRACTVDFKESNRISDIRAIGLNENQKDDILIKLEEEEQNMVSTVTSAIYNTAKYNEAIEEADKNIRRGIGQRMTKKKTVICSLIAILAYFFGFLPLIFSNLNTFKSFLFSIGITAATIAVFAICGFVCLNVLKKKLINRFKHFNYVMSGICSDIRRSLESFSNYLGHACMVMREKSVLDLAETKETDDADDIRMLRYNLTELEKEIEKSHRLLTSFSDEDAEDLLSAYEKSQVIPFDFDYTKQGNFKYAVFDVEGSKEIEYMLKGHTVEVPMLCVERVTLKREELYD